MRNNTGGERAASDQSYGGLKLVLRCAALAVLGGLVALVPGCMGLQNVLRVNFCEPSQYCVPEDRCATMERNRELAEMAWAQVVGADAGICYSVYYMEGFLDGFADYLTLGGTGAAPPVPPRCYWNLDFRTPAGVEATREWYAGFEHGAAEAQQSGIREVSVVPTPVEGPLPPPNVPAEAGAIAGAADPGAMLAPAPMAPVPEAMPAPMAPTREILPMPVPELK